jgi:hypothetical protein
MKVLRITTLSVVVGIGIASWTYGQAGGGGQGGGGGQAGGAGGQAGGQAGAGAQAGGAAQGQAGARGQAGAGMQGQRGAAAGARGQAGLQGPAGMQQGQVSPSPFGINQTPFFMNPQLRQQLQLNDNQFNQLNRAHQRAFGEFQQGFGNLNSLTPDQRREREMQLRGNFNSTFSQSVEQILTDARQRERFGQLSNQFQGFGAFEDPALRQRLNLTNDQLVQLRRFGNQWERELAAMRQNPQGHTTADAAARNRRLAELHRQRMQRINSILTPEQQEIWNNSIGEPFEFGFDSFFPPETPEGNSPTASERSNTTTGGRTSAPPIVPRETAPIR